MIHRFKFKTSSYSFFLFFFLFFVACKNNTAQIENHAFTNELIKETSPYLLQHAHNPVNWKPWSDQVFAEATKEDKLVIISIGYSSCHWCHVMEEETFEDEKVAEIMNTNFISIKVDREERPDVDQVYMTAVQLMTGNGGWPLNVIVLPNGKPIYGGTYHTNAQWSEILLKINTLYKDDPKKANEYSDMVANGIQDLNLIKPSDATAELSPTLIDDAISQWKPNWDLKWGGNSGAQKFMLPGNLDFLMDYGVLSGKDDALAHVKNTLDQMTKGGIYDHVAGGFYRYSTDSQWNIPHFEKMLYDNAQLISLYSKAYTLFNNPVYKQIALETIAFLQKEMKNKEGGYFAAIDADSEGEEGKYYVWTDEELKRHIDKEYDLFTAYYSTASSKKMEGDKIVLRKNRDDETFAKEHQLSLSRLSELKGIWRTSLLEARKERVKPRIDDKIIVSWNALLINGYVDAFKAFGDQKFLDEAKVIYNTIKEAAYNDNQLVHSYKKGSKRSEGFLEDYAFLANASLNLYSASLDAKYLIFSQQLVKSIEEKFKDEATDFYKFNSSNSLIANIIKNDDGVIPSPNAVMCHNLIQLGHIEYNKDYMKSAESMLKSMQPLLQESVVSYTLWASSFLKKIYPYYEIAVVGTDARTLTSNLHKKHLPNTLIVGSTKESELALFEGRYVSDGTYIYVCRDNTCKLPVDTVEGALEQLQNF
ncbi:MAG: thioredoxin domain-containing protein [Maribacter sp.]|nr:thioredoxin domain-containing protein [Maribacter sp.]